ncbi:MAG: 2TM domain-containing protein [Desulfobacterales bacterium]|nr:2TM domain-containing protein [Desulfobacterales bacterium]
MEVKFGFFIHLSVYIVVNLLLIIINLSTSTQYLWFKWPLMGWGVGLFFHALSVFLFSTGSAIKEKMNEKEIKKEALRKQKG